MKKSKWNLDYYTVHCVQLQWVQLGSVKVKGKDSGCGDVGEAITKPAET